MTPIRKRRGSGWQTDSPRVLIECAPHDSPDIIADVVRQEGYEVAVCAGPDHGHPCDLLEHGACALVDGADVVVNLLGSHVGDHIGEQIASARRPAPLVKEVGLKSTTRPNAALDSNAVTVTKRVTGPGLVAAIRRALGRAGQQPPMWGDGQG